MTSMTRSTLRYRVALTIGFLSATGAVFSAYTEPATGYELSIYASTPFAFWIGISLALLIALGVALVHPNDGVRTLTALALATFAVLSIVSLPLLRGYTYYGRGDPMSHLGWSREIRDGVLNPLDFLYPGIHLTANYLADVAGVELTRALVLIPKVAFTLVFVVLFAMCVSAMTSGRWGLVLGVFAALLFVPINMVSVHMVAHPSSQTILFLPVALYLMFRYLTDPTDALALFKPFGVLFAIVCVGLVFIHPQEALSFLVLLGTVAVVQHGARRVASTHPIAAHNSVLPHAIVMAVTFLVWTPRHERARSSIRFTFETLITGSGETLTEATGRGVSLAQLGGSLEELFVKLFAVTVVFCLLALLVFLTAFRGRLRESPRTDPIVGYLSLGAVPLCLIFLVVFFADRGDQYFRFLGVIMVPVTLLGTVALARFASNTERRISRSHLAVALGVVLAGFLIMQLAVVHASPYIYQSNAQVTDQELKGHANTFEHHDGETPLTAPRDGARRHIDAHFGWTTARTELGFPGYREGIPEEAFSGDITTHYDEDRYIVLTEANYQREVVLLRELRYTEAGFEQFENEPQIARLQDNGEFRMYRLTAA